jgi:hypothetical protein
MFVGLLCSVASACKRQVQRQIDHALRAYDPALLKAFTANRGGLLGLEAEHSSVYEFVNDQPAVKTSHLWFSSSPVGFESTTLRFKSNQLTGSGQGALTPVSVLSLKFLGSRSGPHPFPARRPACASA